MVVSDTSPLSNLLMIGRIHLLSDLFEYIFIPSAVWNELKVLDEFGVDLTPIQDAAWISIQAPANEELIFELRQDLDPGEAESIALAIELNIATILIDEKPGRLIAKHYQLTPTGVLGILLRAKREGLIPLVKPEVEKLINQAKFYISQPLYAMILRLAGEE